MTEKILMRYTARVDSSGFAQTLTERVDAYFEARGISRHANAEMLSKTVFGFAFWISTYCLIMSNWFSPLGLIGVFVLHGFAQLFITFNIGHDANHRAYSKNQQVNRVLSCVFDLVGGSSYMWRLMHNDSHHAFINIEAADTAIHSNSVLRFSPGAERSPLHRYQHIYASFAYCLSTLDWVFVKDFYWLFFKKDFGNRRIVQHPWNDILFILATKILYYTYLLILPILYLDVPWYFVILGFLCMHFLTGFVIALIFQPTHITEGSVYSHPDEDGSIANNYINHVFETTADFARENPFACWILGCLNLHVIHHMFPAVCHVHYPALTAILRSTAEEYGLEYRENKTVFGAYCAHLRLLRALGRVDDPFLSEAQVETAG